MFNLSTNDNTETKLNVTELNFSFENWDVPQAVLVIGVDDSYVDGNQTSRVTIEQSDYTTAPAYRTRTLPAQNVTVITTDNDTAQFKLLLSPPGNFCVVDEEAGAVV